MVMIATKMHKCRLISKNYGSVFDCNKYAGHPSFDLLKKMWSVVCLSAKNKEKTFKTSMTSLPPGHE